MQSTHRPLTRRRILVFEWLCGGGLLLDGLHPDELGGLVAQGRAMLQAVCADFLAAGAEVHVPVDHRMQLEIGSKFFEIPEAKSIIRRLGELIEDADAVLLIAPESGGQLEKCLEWFKDSSSKLLNPDLEFTRLCSNKNRLQKHLSDHGVAVPDGCPAQHLNEFNFQSKNEHGFVIKPNDGCGGAGIEFVETLDIEAISGKHADARIEEFIPGQAVSVSAIATANGFQQFPALRQRFDSQPVGHFSRCTDDLNADVAHRSKELAEKTIAALPKTTGYFGIDMIIGARDVVVEVNPRLTMSYPVLRDKMDFNLAELMLASKPLGV